MKSAHVKDFINYDSIKYDLVFSNSIIYDKLVNLRNFILSGNA